jgi:hypothetical protein
LWIVNGLRSGVATTFGHRGRLQALWQGEPKSFESNRLRGISWGPDGRPGGGDKIVYDINKPWSYTTPVRFHGEAVFISFQ